MLNAVHWCCVNTVLWSTIYIAFATFNANLLWHLKTKSKMQLWFSHFLGRGKRNFFSFFYLFIYFFRVLLLHKCMGNFSDRLFEYTFITYQTWLNSFSLKFKHFDLEMFAVEYSWNIKVFMHCHAESLCNLFKDTLYTYATSEQ